MLVNSGLELPREIRDSFVMAVQSRRINLRAHEAMALPDVLLGRREDAQGADRRILKADELSENTVREFDDFIIREGPNLSPAITRLQRVMVRNPRGTSKVEIPRFADLEGVAEGMNPEPRGEPGVRLEGDTVSISLPYCWLYGSYETDLDAAWTPHMMEQSMAMMKALMLHLEQRPFVGTGAYSGAQGFGFNHASIDSNASGTNKWTTAAKDGSTYESDTLGILSRLTDDRRYGDISMFLHPTANARLAKRFSDNYSQSVRARLLEIVDSIEPSTGIDTPTRVYAVVPGDGTCRIAMPIPPMVHSWISPAGYMREVLVVARMAPAFVTSFGTDGTDGKIAAQILT